MFSNVKPGFFARHYNSARLDYQMIGENTSPFDAVRGTLFYYWSNGFDHAGYAIRGDGELVYVFSTSAGKGDDIVSHAVMNGATHLDCFDGYLPKLYERHGFIDYKRELNWIHGNPDVVYMQHSENINRRQDSWQSQNRI